MFAFLFHAVLMCVCVCMCLRFKCVNLLFALLLDAWNFQHTREKTVIAIYNFISMLVEKISLRGVSTFCVTHENTLFEGEILMTPGNRFQSLSKCDSWVFYYIIKYVLRNWSKKVVIIAPQWRIRKVKRRSEDVLPPLTHYSGSIAEISDKAKHSLSECHFAFGSGNSSCLVLRSLSLAGFAHWESYLFGGWVVLSVYSLVSFCIL